MSGSGEPGNGPEHAPRFADRWILPLFAVGAGALLAAPSAMPGIAPQTFLVTLFVAVGAGAVFERRRVVHLLAAILSGFAAEHLLFAPGIPRGHDLLAHSWGLWAFFQAMKGGDPTPEWLHHMSLGLPLPMFYSPATYYATTPFYWAGLSAVEILKGAFLLHTVVGTVSMYYVGRRWTGSSRAGWIAAAAYAFAPYRLTVVHHRAALAESQAMALFPLLFGLFFDPAEWSRRRIAAASVVAGLMILTHPLSVLTTAVAALVWQGIDMFSRKDGRFQRLGFQALAATLGLAIAAFFVAPLVSRLDSISMGFAVESRDVEAPEDAQTRLAENGLGLEQPLQRLSFNRPPEEHSLPRGDSVYFGCGLFLCVVLSAAMGLRRAWKQQAWPRPVSEVPIAIVALVSLLLTLRPAAAVMSHLPLLPILQFPWRFFGPATFAGALAAAFLARSLITSGRPVYVAVLLVLLAADGLPYTGASDWIPPYQGFVHLYNRNPACAERWGCWQREPIEGPIPWRVTGTVLPPSSFDLNVAHATPGFGTFLNPLAVRFLQEARRNGKLEKLGVGLEAPLSRPGVKILSAEPFARFVPPSSKGFEPLEAEIRSGTIEVHLPGEEGALVVLEQYRPEWKADVDGRNVAVEPTEQGLIRLSVEPGSRRARIRFHYAGWDVGLGRATTGLAWAFCLVLALKRRSKEGKPDVES